VLAAVRDDPSSVGRRASAAYLTVDGRPLPVHVEIARTRKARRRGLLGRARLDGVLVLAPCRQVHTIGMREAIEVAFCRFDGVVVRVVTLTPGRVSRWVRRCRFVVEAPAGLLSCSGVRAGCVVAVREHASHES
jgi:uncharacterized membrane protein (UPF0127 family)